MTEAHYRLIEASGQLAQAACALLAWLYEQERGYECRCCHQTEHDPSMPCGQLRDALAQLGPAVRAVTLPAGVTLTIPVSTWVYCPLCAHIWHSINACPACDCHWYAGRPGPQRAVTVEQARRERE